MNCGTNHDESKNDVIAVLRREKLAGTQNKDWTINPGPGSADAVHKALTSDPSAKLIVQMVESKVPPAALAGDKLTAEILGTTTGLSIQANVDGTLAVLRSINFTQGLINMAAWSRGAVTSILIANRLRLDPNFRGCHVNMFLFDPVPGPHVLNTSNWARLRKIFPDNVRQCSVIFMEDVTDFLQVLFIPLVESFTHNKEGHTQFHLYLLPGLHSSAVKWDPNDQTKWYPSYLIGRHLCYKFLYEHGTPLINREKGSWLIHHPYTLCNFYAILKLLILEVWRGISIRRMWQISNPLRNDPYFVNEHNRHMFRRAFPKTSHPSSGNRLLADVDEEPGHLARGFLPLAEPR